MKYLILVISIFVLFILMFGGRFKINNERMGIMFVKPYYRAYWIRYSNGLKHPYRTFRDNLWCAPKYESVNIKNFIQETTQFNPIDPCLCQEEDCSQ